MTAYSGQRPASRAREAHRICWAVIALLLCAAWGTAQQVTSLLDSAEPTFGWTFDNGQEFPGATGSLTVDDAVTHDGRPSLKLQGDFSGGGQYVQLGRRLPDVDIDEISLWLKYPNARTLTTRVVDSGGQCHQIGLQVRATDEWQHVRFPLTQFFKRMGTPDAVEGVARYEKWGGANDGRWHGPATGLYLLTGLTDPDTKTTVLWVADVEALANPAQAPAQAVKTIRLDGLLREGENDWQLNLGWEFPGAKGALEVVEQDDRHCLRLSGDFEEGGAYVGMDRSLRGLEVEAVSSIRLRMKSDNVEKYGLRFVDATGQCHQRKGMQLTPDGQWHEVVFRPAEVAGGEHWGGANDGEWHPPAGLMALNIGADSARDSKRPSLYVTDISAEVMLSGAAEAAGPGEKRIYRVLLASDRLGNLLFPDDEAIVHMTVEALRPLPPSWRSVSFVARDYWGAEQGPAGKAALEEAGRTDEYLRYEAELDLSAFPLELGKYYEVHVEIPREGGEPYREFTTLARLPEALTKQYAPEEVPFTSRNWDNRIREYFFLSDRLGIRVCGIWSGWSEKPPYEPTAPGVQWCQELDMGVLAHTPASEIERDGFTKYDRQSLRQGASRFVREYGDEGLLFVSLGNEPHGDFEKAQENVSAYRELYEGIKEADPDLTVIGTSVGPAEDYFKAGFQEYQDVYDFHTYEDYGQIPRVFGRYEQLFEQYGVRKPICSTELGLNSQGVTRHAVASVLIKKLALFFACGGEHCSWFTILYPDPEGKIAQSAGQAHNVFYCRYNMYCPKLDAIAYYNMVNGICVKTFAEQRRYDDDTEAYLLRDRDDRCLQVVWNEAGRRDVLIPLPGVRAVEIVRVDGERAPLDARGEGVTVDVSAEPILLLYEQPNARLAETLAEPAVSLGGPPPTGVRGDSVAFLLSRPDLSPEDATVAGPPEWEVLTEPAAGGVKCTVRIPAETTAREARVRVTLNGPEGPTGQLVFGIPVVGDSAARVEVSPAEEPATHP